MLLKESQMMNPLMTNLLNPKNRSRRLDQNSWPSFGSKIRQVYFMDICWPYTASFYLTLVIFFIEYWFNGSLGWHSFGAYFILIAYYLVNLFYYLTSRLSSINPLLFIQILTLKILIWGFIFIVFLSIL